MDQGVAKLQRSVHEPSLEGGLMGFQPQVLVFRSNNKKDRTISTNRQSINIYLLGF